MRDFNSLSQKEILALAISLEEEDERIYSDFGENLRENFPGTAQVFEEMRQEEIGHRRRLIELYQQKFGEHIPLIRRQDIRGFVQRKPIWLNTPLRLEQIRRQVGAMEVETRRFYEHAAARAAGRQHSPVARRSGRRRGHACRAGRGVGEDRAQARGPRRGSQSQRRLFVLQIVQPGLAGLMDGSVSTLAPVFAAAFATKNTWDAFAVGLAASLGAGISMGFAEALSDDGSLTGRGTPWLRGLVCGAMTALGGIGHTLPYLIHDFRIATTIAIIVVLFELATITWVRNRFMDTPPLSAAIQVAFGGALVFATGILIGTS